MTRARFITLEGGEGAGKSSSLAHLRALVEAAGHRVDVTREPGGTALAESIRELLLAERTPAMPAMTELLLMFAARSSHIAERIAPALADGRWVLCDRFTDASFAYQGTGRALGDGPVATLETLVQGDLRPDRTLLFDVPVDIGLARARNRGAQNRFDTATRDFHERIRAAYLARARAAPARYRVIDASQAPADVNAQIATALEDWL